MRKGAEPKWNVLMRVWQDVDTVVTQTLFSRVSKANELYRKLAGFPAATNPGDVVHFLRTLKENAYNATITVTADKKNFRLIPWRVQNFKNIFDHYAYFKSHNVRVTFTLQPIDKTKHED